MSTAPEILRVSPLHFLITAGPTREPIDPVRYISNRSSGKMGYAIAIAAADRGHLVQLVSGPVSLQPIRHPRVETVNVETAREMYLAVAARLREAQVAVMAAAVSDYRPRTAADRKIKKSGRDELVIELEKTDDILGSARSPLGFEGVLVGFAAETDRVAEYAREKLERKKCDLVVANDVSRRDIGFDAEDNELSLFFADGETAFLPKASKPELAFRLIELMEALVRSKGAADKPEDERELPDHC